MTVHDEDRSIPRTGAPCHVLLRPRHLVEVQLRLERRELTDHPTDVISKIPDLLREGSRHPYADGPVRVALCLGTRRKGTLKESTDVVVPAINAVFCIRDLGFVAKSRSLSRNACPFSI
jgi:hypothetical protein